MKGTTCAALLLLLLAVARAAVYVPGDDQQFSYVFTLPANQSESEDMPLDEPPLVRTVTGFEPEGIHLTQWTSNAILVSWQTGEPLIDSNSDPPQPYDPSTVRSVVRWGTLSGNLTEETEQDHRLVYTYVYGPVAGNTTYQSPILHHVLLRDLEPDTTYYYSVGDEAHGFSEELSFHTVGGQGGYPLRIGVIGDLGETYNSTQTLAGLTDAEPDLVLLVGDYTYANDHLSGDASGKGQKLGSNISETSSEQPRWDGWARMMQPLLSRAPLLGTGGNHEIEQLLLDNNATFTSVNARYPVPQEPDSDVLMTGPNYGAWYLNQSGWFTQNHSQFKNESDFVPQSGYFSLDLPGVHIISLHSYLPWGKESRQYRWLKEDLAAVDRQRTPWLIVYFHASVYHSYVSQYMQANTFRTVYEPLFYERGVDLVFAGHTHAYERTFAMYNFTRDDCGPMYITIGDGGNVEGLSTQFIDQQPQQPFCSNVSLYDVPPFQPIDREEPVITLQDGLFCPTSQPAWSAFREQSFGFGMLEILNGTHAAWEWRRNENLGPGESDVVNIVRVPDGACNLPSPAPAPQPAPASRGSTNLELLPLLLLGMLLAAPAILLL